MNLRLIGALLAGFAVVTSTGVAGPAHASDLIATQFVLSATPNPVSYPNPQVTFSGVLETAGQSPQPLMHEMVDLIIGYAATLSEIPLRTDASGQFSWTQTIPVPGAFEMFFGGDGTYAGTRATMKLTGAQTFPAKIVLNPVAPVPYLSWTSVTGRVLMQLPGGSWVPSPYVPVIPCGDQSAGAWAWTDASGYFSLGMQADPQQDCTIKTPAGTPSSWWSGPASTPRVIIPLTALPTRFTWGGGTDFTPSPVADIGFYESAAYTDASGGWHAYSHATVELFFRAPGSTTWRLMKTAQTDSAGKVHLTVSGYLPGGGLAAGLWKWVLPAAPGYLAAQLRAFGAVISVPSLVRGARIQRSGGLVHLAGTLAYLASGGPISGATVVIQKLSAGQWRRVGTAVTAASGAFAFRLSARATGRYRVRYAGGRLPGAQAPYGFFLPVISAVVRLT